MNPHKSTWCGRFESNRKLILKVPDCVIMFVSFFYYIKNYLQSILSIYSETNTKVGLHFEQLVCSLLLQYVFHSAVNHSY